MMRSNSIKMSRRNVLLLPAAIVSSGALANSLSSKPNYFPTAALLGRGNHFVNPEIPKNWREGAKSLDNAKFNPFGRSLNAINLIFSRKRRGLPHPAYGVMGTVLELRKPLGELPED